jgi:haloalkane dehalogenase
VTDAVRTPDELFIGLPGVEALGEPAFRQWEGLRLAHHDVGDGPPVVFFHGEPTWAYLWRKVIPPVRDAGFRCIAPDLPGFGRSDKPIDLGWYSYERHVAAMADLFEALDLRDATVVVHDWGGPIGLRIAAEHADRVAALVILDTGLFTGRQHMSEAWQTFRAFVERTEDLPVGMLLRRGCHTDPGDEVAAAYDAPYVNADAKAGARAFPLMVPLSPQEQGAEAGQRVLEALVADDRPTLMLWGAEDPILTPAAGERFAQAIGREPPEQIPDAGHFLQEDQGELIGRRIAEWLAAGPPRD